MCSFDVCSPDLEADNFHVHMGPVLAVLVLATSVRVREWRDGAGDDNNFVSVRVLCPARLIGWSDLLVCVPVVKRDDTICVQVMLCSYAYVGFPRIVDAAHSGCMPTQWHRYVPGSF